MDHAVLMSRLRATCQGAGVKWARDEHVESLAKKLLEVSWLDAFSEQFDLHFNSDTGELTDLRNVARAMWVTEGDGNGEDEEK